MQQDELMVATNRTNLTQHDLWRCAVILTFEVESGTMGFILNQPVSNITPHQLTGMYRVGEMPVSRIWCGGPQMTERCTVLHSPDYANADTRPITQQASITFNREIIRDIREGQGPRHYKIMLGFCQWESGQLDAELTRGVWHTVGWRRTAWSNYKRKDKMWRRIIESESVMRSHEFMDSVWSAGETGSRRHNRA